MASFAKPSCDEALILSGSCAGRTSAGSRWILATTILGSSMAFIDGTVVNIALPALQSGLGATISQVQSCLLAPDMVGFVMESLIRK